MLPGNFDREAARETREAISTQNDQLANYKRSRREKSQLITSAEAANRCVQPCKGRMPYEPCDTSTFRKMKLEFSRKLLNIFLPIFHVILFTFLSDIFENYKEKYY